MAVFAASQALDMAVKVEENGEAFYRAAAERQTESDLKALFEDLAGRERSHREVFERMAAEVEETPEPAPSDVGDYESFLTVALDQALFSGPDKALRMAKEAQDRAAVLRAAMGFEKDTMLFYYDLREMVGEKDREVVSDIIREEKQHLLRLTRQA